MNINAINEISMKKNNLKLRESNPQPTTPETITSEPEKVMNALHIQGMNNVAFKANPARLAQAAKNLGKKAAVALPLIIGAGALTTTTTSCDPDFWNPQPIVYPIDVPNQRDSVVVNVEVNNQTIVNIEIDQSIMNAWLEKLYNQGQISQEQNAKWQAEMLALIQKYGDDAKAYQEAMLAFAKQIALSSSSSAEDTARILARIEEIENMWKNGQITWEEALKLLSQINDKLDTIIGKLDDIIEQNEANHQEMIREQNKANELLDRLLAGQLSFKEFEELKEILGTISGNVDVIKNNTFDLIAIAKDPTRHEELIETIKNSANDPIEFEKFEELFKFYGLTIADAITMTGDELADKLALFMEKYAANEALNQQKLDEIIAKIGKLLDSVGKISNDLNTYYNIFDGYWTKALALLGNISGDISELKEMQKDANKMLNALLKKADEFEALLKDNQGMTVDEFKEALQERDQKQYEKWVQFTIDMGLDKLAGDVATIKEYVVAMKGKLDGMKDYSAQLDRIIAILDGLDLTSAENQKILKAIKEAIENHKCDCNCGDNGNHEGILGDVEDALNGLL